MYALGVLHSIMYSQPNADPCQIRRLVKTDGMSYRVLCSAGTCRPRSLIPYRYQRQLRRAVCKTTLVELPKVGVVIIASQGPTHAIAEPAGHHLHKPPS